MAFVKLDCGILNSSLWVDRSAREIFVTALLMAVPRQFDNDIVGIEIGSCKPSGFVAPAGCYGFVAAAGPGIIRQAGLELREGTEALERLNAPDLDSRSTEFEGRRMIRIDGGYLILNYDKYREKDHTAAQRMKQYRARKLTPDTPPNGESVGVNSDVTDRNVTPSHAVTDRNVTQAEAEAEAYSTNAPTSSTRAPASSEQPTPKPERKRNPLFDTLAECCGLNPLAMTKTEGGRVGSALADIRTADPNVTVEEIRRRAANYRKEWPDCELTPTALSGNWTRMGGGKPPKAETWVDRAIAKQRQTPSPGGVR